MAHLKKQPERKGVFLEGDQVKRQKKEKKKIGCSGRTLIVNLEAYLLQLLEE
ncbi:MAG: hypothetical protein IPN95_23530 [Bacteroidetes bacterium]|nr:hypothetical protein [Bacteroidota bacterium]